MTKKEEARMHEARWLKRVQDLEHVCKCQQAELEAIKVRLAFDSPGIEFVLPVREDIP